VTLASIEMAIRQQIDAAAAIKDHLSMTCRMVALMVVVVNSVGGTPTKIQDVYKERVMSKVKGEVFGR